MTDIYQWRRVAHIPFIIILQIIFIILFGVFVVYDPELAIGPADPTPASNNKSPVNTSQPLGKETSDKVNLDQKLVPQQPLGKQASGWENYDPNYGLTTREQCLKDKKKQSNQEHGEHSDASKLISNVYPCT